MITIRMATSVIIATCSDLFIVDHVFIIFICKNVSLSNFMPTCLSQQRQPQNADVSDRRIPGGSQM